MYKDLKLVLSIITASGLFILITTLIVLALDKRSCHATWKDFQPDYGFWTGCMIHQDGQLVPVENVRFDNLIEKK